MKSTSNQDMAPMLRVLVAAAAFGIVSVLSSHAAIVITKSSFDNGVGASTSEHHSAQSTLGEGLVGTSESKHHEIVWGFFAFVGQPCATSAVCDDGSVCTFDDCTNTLCAYSPVRYGDVNGSGASDGAAIPNLDDILCVLQGFSSFTACINGDIAPVCTGDGQINLDDILAVLAAFSSADPCNCTT